MNLQTSNESLVISESYDAARMAEEIYNRLYPLQRDATDTEERKTCIRDLCMHMNKLSEALNTNNPALFSEYIAWTSLVLDFNHVNRSQLIDVLNELSQSISAIMDSIQAERIIFCIKEAINRINSPKLIQLEEIKTNLENQEVLSDDLNKATRLQLSSLTLTIFYMRNPNLALKHGSEEQSLCYRDINKHIEVLNTSIQRSDFRLFAEYSRWTAQFLHWLGINRLELSELLECASAAADICLSGDLADAAAESLLEASRIVREENISPMFLASMPNRSAMINIPDDIRQCLHESGESLAKLTLILYYMRYPEDSLVHGEAGRNSCLKDTIIHFEHMTDAILAESESIFSDYLDWVKNVLKESGVEENVLQQMLGCMSDALKLVLPDAMVAPVIDFVSNSADSLEIHKPQIDSYIDESTHFGQIARQYNNLLLNGDRHKASELIMQTLKSGTSIQDIYIEVFQSSQYEVGLLWQRNEISVAQEHFCSAATQMIMSQLYPYIFQNKRLGLKMVATCATRDMHEIGIRMICDFFEMEGWDTYYLGANSPAESVISAVVEHQVDILAVSATIGTHIGYVENIISAMRENEICRDIPVIVGGLPFLIDEHLWQKIGANGFARNAHEAIKLSHELMN